MKPTYVLIGVDMETDVGSFSPFYEGVKHGTPRLINLLSEMNVRGTFFSTRDCAKIDPNLLKQISISIMIPAAYVNFNNLLVMNFFKSGKCYIDRIFKL